MVRPLLILDLDETLVHATTQPLDIDHAFRCDQYFIHERPFVREFLIAVADAWDLAVWTSSAPDYAECIRSHLFADVSLVFLWTRERCTGRFDAESQQRYWVKDLRKVKRAGYDLSRVLMVDDLPQALERNYGNLLTVKPFEGDPADAELRSLAPYLVGLACEENLRSIEKRGWRDRR